MKRIALALVVLCLAAMLSAPQAQMTGGSGVNGPSWTLVASDTSSIDALQLTGAANGYYTATFATGSYKHALLAVRGTQPSSSRQVFIKGYLMFSDTTSLDDSYSGAIQDLCFLRPMASADTWAASFIPISTHVVGADTTAMAWVSFGVHNNNTAEPQVVAPYFAFEMYKSGSNATGSFEWRLYMR